MNSIYKGNCNVIFTKEKEQHGEAPAAINCQYERIDSLRTEKKRVPCISTNPSSKVSSNLICPKMSLELYKDLDCEFDRLLADIQSRLGQFPAQMTASAQSARSGIDQIDSSIKECADTMRQIELELKGLDAATRKSLNDVFTEKKRRFGDLKQQADEKRAQVQREELMTSKGRAAHAMQTNMNKCVVFNSAYCLRLL
jgi:DNA anti-recombination protein RmuC